MNEMNQMKLEQVIKKENHIQKIRAQDSIYFNSEL
jgi:hypothetical protein